ncbi:MAG: hypothetical protein GQ570_03870 [Helicobacteraceae bacterium]|nr:hypothetical protein [Helicobacteraceae bacterium]
MADLVQECIDDIKAKVETVTALKNKIAFYYHIDEMLDENNILKFPAVAIVYEGMNSQDSKNKGLSNQATFGVYMIGCAGKPAKPELETITLLKSLRDSVKNSKSPTAHDWNFVGEHIIQLPVSSASGTAYRQGWMTQLMIS